MKATLFGHVFVFICSLFLFVVTVLTIVHTDVQIYAWQLWVLSSQLTTLSDYDTHPGPSALYLAMFAVCSIAPETDLVFLLRYFAASRVHTEEDWWTSSTLLEKVPWRVAR